jgi:hypothetical protein
MFRMNSDLPTVLQGVAAAGTSQHPSRSDHRHSALDIEQVLFRLTDADMNVLTDQAFTREWTFDSYLITEIRATGASTDLTAADGGIYNAAAKGGDALVAAAQVYTALSSAAKALSLTLASEGKAIQTATPILALTGTQGGAATCDFVIIGIPLSEA